MNKSKRKTLKDYLHKEGVQGKFFFSRGFNDKLRGVYEVQFVYVTQENNEISLITRPILGNDIRQDVYLKYHFEDRESTFEEVQRAKEGQLAQKTNPPRTLGSFNEDGKDEFS